jgi:hypothetical protein
MILRIRNESEFERIFSKSDLIILVCFVLNDFTLK